MKRPRSSIRDFFIQIKGRIWLSPNWKKLVFSVGAVLLVSPATYSAIRFDVPVGASNYNIDALTQKLTVYAGVAGDPTAGECATNTGDGTCDNCSGDLNSCNHHLVRPNSSLLKLTFRSDIVK